MSNGYIAKGLKFNIGKYRFRLYWTLFEYSDSMNGRVYFFPWSRMFWR